MPNPGQRDARLKRTGHGERQTSGWEEHPSHSLITTLAIPEALQDFARTYQGVSSKV